MKFNKKHTALFIFFIIVGIIARNLYSNNDNKNPDINNKDVNNVANITISNFYSNIITNNLQIKSLDNAILRFMKKWEIKGASFAIMKGDSLLYAKGYGYSRIEDSTKCTIDNTFRIASVSKLITATAILKLCEENKLSTQSKVFGKDGILNDPKFLDINDKNIQDITIEHLLNHTSGLARPHGDIAFNQELAANFLNKELPLSVDDFVLYATKIKQKEKAGTWYHYSNLGYIILSKVIEKVSGMSYENYVRDSILIPNGCNNIYLAQNFTKDFRDNEVFYYEVKEAKPIPAYDGSNRKVLKSRGGNNIRVLSGAGGWVASPIELLKFVTTINNNTKINKFLSQESINYMTEDHNRPIGWASVNNSEWIRTGSMPGTSSIIKSEKDGYTWVFISNSSSWNGPSLPKQINRDISKAISNVKEWPNTNYSFDYYLY